MAWRAITNDDVKSCMSGSEYATIKDSYLADEQGDPIPGVITQVVDEARGHILASGQDLEAGSTVPASLIRACLHVIRFTLLTRYATSTLITEDRRKENENALALFKLISEKKFQVEAPTTAATTAAQASGMEQASTPTRVATREKLAGL